MLAVLARGPSSKVRATVLLLPGADLWAPYGILIRTKWRCPARGSARENVLPGGRDPH